MHTHHTVLTLLAAGSAAIVAACGSSGPEGATPPPSRAPRAESTPPGVPFQFQGAGESSSPTFHVGIQANYAVAYTVTGSAQQPDCMPSIGLVADDGESRQVLAGVKLSPTDSKQGSVTLQLSAGNWRFQEGGGCNWKVSVSAAG